MADGPNRTWRPPPIGEAYLQPQRSFMPPIVVVNYTAVVGLPPRNPS
jgi:hypothetical protein